VTCLAAILFSGMLSLAALGIFYLIGWVARLLFTEPPFILTIIETYSAVEVTVIFVISLIGFILIVTGRLGKKEEGD
jgi:hypothetical protein